MPVRVGAQLEHARVTLDEAVGPRPDRNRVVGRGDPAKGVFTSNDRDLEIRQKRGVWFVEDEEDGSRVGHAHLSDPPIGVRVAASELRIDDALKGGHHVFGVQSATITEAQAIAEPHLELGRARGSDRLREIRYHFECPRIDRDQRAEEES